MHYFIGLFDTDGIYFSQPHELGQGTENRLNGTLALAFHVPPLWAVYPFVVAFIFFSVIGNAELLLLCALAQTITANRAICAYVFSRSIFFLSCSCSVIIELFCKGYYLALRTYIMVAIFVVGKIIGTALIGAVWWYKAFQAHLFKHGIVLATTITCVGHTVLPDKTCFPQSAFQPFCNVGQLLVVLSICMVGPDISDYMMGRIHTELGEVVQLPGLTGFNTDPRIGVRRAVVRLVRSIFRTLVPRSRSLVLIIRPLLVPALYGL